MKITIDYNNDEIRVEGLGPTAILKVTDKMSTYEPLLLDIFNRMESEEAIFIGEVVIFTENEDKRRVIGDW